MEIGGATRDRTADLLHAMQALSQLSYSPRDQERDARTCGLNCQFGMMIRKSGAAEPSLRVRLFAAETPFIVAQNIDGSQIKRFHTTDILSHTSNTQTPGSAHRRCS